MLAVATIFNTMDTNSGFHQIPLDDKSKHLTTFITPFGRFCHRRLPMGINIGPEVFQLQMQKVLHGLPGCAVIMDDILVWGKTRTEHDNLAQVQSCIQQSGLTLNDAKSQLPVRVTEVELSDEIESYIDTVMAQLPVSDSRISRLQQSMVHDQDCANLMNFTLIGWPVASAVKPSLKVYYEAKDHLSVINGLLVYQNCIVVPPDQRAEILFKLH